MRSLQKAALIVCVFCLAACIQEPLSDAANFEVNRELQDALSVLEAAGLTGSNTYLEVIDRHCSKDNLLTLEEVLSPERTDFSRWDETLSNAATGDEVARIAIAYANSLEDDEAVKDVHLVFLLHESAKRESAIGYNELGASQMYCYQSIKQDIPRAREWLEKAADKHEVRAMLSLARLHLDGHLGDHADIAIGEKYLKKCTSLGNPECREAFEIFQAHRVTALEIARQRAEKLVEEAR